MKKVLHFGFIALLLCFSLMAKAQKTIVFTSANDHVEKDSPNALTIEKDGIRLTISPQGMLTDNKAFRVYQKSSLEIASTVGNITKVELTCTGRGSQNYGPGGFAKNEGYTFEKDGHTGVWTGGSPIVTLTNATKQLRINKITITLNGEISAVSAPKIEGNKLFADSTKVQIIGAEGSTIYYTTDGQTPTTSSLSGKSPLTITLKNSTTLKAIATLNNKNSSVTSEIFTKKEYKNITFEEALTLKNDENFVNVTFNNALVVYSDNGTLHVRQGEKALMLYKSNLNIPVNAIINGSAKFNFVNYHGIPELKDNANTNEEMLTIEPSQDATLQPLTLTITEVNAQKGICDLIKLSDVKIIKEEVNGKENYYATANNEKVILFKNESKYENLANNDKTYTIVAVFNSLFKNQPELKPIEITEETSGIKHSQLYNNVNNNTLYNINGIKVDNFYKGVIIKNGKKYLNK